MNPGRRLGPPQIFMGWMANTDGGLDAVTKASGGGHRAGAGGAGAGLGVGPVGEKRAGAAGPSMHRGGGWAGSRLADASDSDRGAFDSDECKG